MECRWTVREGTNDTYWAFTPCKRGFNYLSKIHRKEDIKDAYENRNCPICGKRIQINLELLEDDTVITLESEE